MSTPLQRHRPGKIESFDGGICLPDRWYALSNGMNTGLALSGVGMPAIVLTGPTLAAQIASIVAPPSGLAQWIRLIIDFASPLTLKHQDSTDESTAANLLICATGADIILQAPSGGLGWIDVQYSTLISRWMVLP